MLVFLNNYGFDPRFSTGPVSVRLDEDQQRWTVVQDQSDTYDAARSEMFRVQGKQREGVDCHRLTAPDVHT